MSDVSGAVYAFLVMAFFGRFFLFGSLRFYEKEIADLIVAGFWLALLVFVEQVCLIAGWI